MCVRWDGSFSDRFCDSNGVQQGGILSPILFTIYVDDLLEDLSKLGIGCYWDSLFAGSRPSSPVSTLVHTNILLAEGVFDSIHSALTSLHAVSNLIFPANNRKLFALNYCSHIPRPRPAFRRLQVRVWESMVVYVSSDRG